MCYRKTSVKPSFVRVYMYVPCSWYCHLDDDIYLIEDNLVKLLSYFDAKNDLVYLGRAGEPYEVSPW